MYVNPLWLIGLVVTCSALISRDLSAAVRPDDVAVVLLLCLVFEAFVWLSGRRKQKAAAVSGASSYKLYRSIRLYVNLAVGLGVLGCFLHWGLLSGAERPVPGSYRYGFAAFLLLVFVLPMLPDAVRRRIFIREKGGFFAGALLSIAAIVFMYCAVSPGWRMAWAVVLAYSLVLMNIVFTGFRGDFGTISRLAGDGYKEFAEADKVSNALAGVLVSAALVLAIALCALVSGSAESLPSGAGIWVLLLSVAAMLAALHSALRLPLNPRNREKLRLYADGFYCDEPKKESLRAMFIEKYRNRFGIKILCSIARPIFHFRIEGRENLRDESLPAVFVCNHGFINGPISAILYLPTFFRPWIHDVMLNRETALREMMFSFSWMRRMFGEKLGSKMISLLHDLVHWAITSFNPIPVVRGASKDVMSTFSLSLEALEHGDNILIFPERPNTRDDKGKLVNDAGRLRNLYTGFAHIGKMYYDKTGRPLIFYPVYSSQKAKRFFIGEPVRYNPDIDSRDAKREVAEELHTKMEALSKRGPRK